MSKEWNGVVLRGLFRRGLLYVCFGGGAGSGQFLGRCVPEHYKGSCSSILAQYVSRPPGFVRILTPNHRSGCRLGTICGSFDIIQTIQLEAKGFISTQQHAVLSCSPDSNSLFRDDLTLQLENSENSIFQRGIAPRLTA